MSDELRQLATAIVALAESNQGIGGAVREQISVQHETNRMLGLIHDQNADILEQMKRSNDRHADSERGLRAVKQTVERHAERIVEIERTLGLNPAAE